MIPSPGKLRFDSSSVESKNFLCLGQGGPKYFFACQEGDQKKMATRDHKQTAPLPVKNDSSLINPIVIHSSPKEKQL